MIKNIFLSIFTLITLLLLLPISCENNNEEELYGECDTINLTWDNSISYIMRKNCVECHGPDIAYRKVRHDSYQSELVVINNGKLRGVINHDSGFTAMPYLRPKLNDCELEKINRWLDNGAPEN